MSWRTLGTKVDISDAKIDHIYRIWTDGGRFQELIRITKLSTDIKTQDKNVLCETLAGEPGYHMEWNVSATDGEFFYIGNKETHPEYYL